MSNSDLLPQSIEAEVGVLGSILVEDSVLGDIIAILDKTYFLSPIHQSIYEVISFLFDNNQPIGPVSVAEELKRRKLLDQIGGQGYLISLMETVFSASNVEYYARVVREKGIMRQLIQAAHQIQAEAKSEHLDLDTLLDNSEKIIFEVTQKNISSEPAHIDSLLCNIITSLEQEAADNGISSGFRDLDDLIGGLQGSSLVIIAGRPSMGKTTFALNVGAYIGLHEDAGVLIFSLEMSREQLARNILCSRASISPQKISSGMVQHDEYARITEMAGTLGKAPIYIDDTPSISVREMRAKARRFKTKHKTGLIIIDYIQLIEGAGGGHKAENRQQEISRISRSLKSLARELDYPVLALSQLNRSVDARDDHRPRMSDLRESGALEQDADLILFLYREDYYNKETTEKGVAEVIVAKHRNGPTGNIKLAFVKEHMRFLCLNQRDQIFGAYTQ